MGTENESDRAKKGPDKTGSNNNNSQNKSALQRGRFNSVVKKRFDGKCNDLKGHIYDCSDSHKVDLYSKTTKEISEYVGRDYKKGSDVQWSIENLQPFLFTLPVDVPTNATDTAKLIWSKEVNAHAKREIQHEENLRYIYSLAWDQCTEIMRSKLEIFTTRSSSIDRMLKLRLLGKKLSK